MSWKDKLKERWYLYHYSKELDSFTTCGREIETFITFLLKKERDEMPEMWTKLNNYFKYDC